MIKRHFTPSPFGRGSGRGETIEPLSLTSSISISIIHTQSLPEFSKGILFYWVLLSIHREIAKAIIRLQNPIFSVKMKALLIVCLFLLNFILSGSAVADDDKQDQQSPNQNNQLSITLDVEAQRLSGLKTITLEQAVYRAEFTAYGKAISIQPLLALRSRYLLALTERKRAVARFKQSGQASERMQMLYRHGVTAKRNLQDQQAQWQSDKAQLDASDFQDQSIKDEALLNWGDVLTEWALSADPDKLNVFLTGQQTLLQITLPANHQLVDGNRVIFIEVSGDRSKATKAELISTAPQTDNTAQGTSYFFQSDSKNIRPGMNISAWVPEQNADVPGVIIPKSAVIWYMDQAFVYLKTAEDSFSRVTLNNYSLTTDGYFISDAAIKSGQQVVTTGGQMLLSEALREQIPDEDD